MRLSFLKNILSKIMLTPVCDLFGGGGEDPSDIYNKQLGLFTSPVFDYNFLMRLDEKKYPKYLCLAYYLKTGTKLNLKNPKNLSQKIQWLKIYDNLPIKQKLTDKVLVRDYVKEKIGEEYLKPVLWIGDKFDDIPFDKMPDSFIIKCNHGCKWHTIIKDRKKFLENKILFRKVKETFDLWLSQSFFGISNFELQYKGINPKIIIEELMRNNINEDYEEFYVWCANSIPYIMDENKELRKQAMELSHVLSTGFKFVRIDWILFNKKLYFAEMTFTPFSGFIPVSKDTDDFYAKISDNLSLK